ncbi:hypothetical protein NODU109028_18080 [Nocardioides dubius]|uniref:Fibronectin type-III domain-containing protein n=1 Tax=Nocardioides dubius TaxID=317019 RepID=A0ABN1U279_9ACTN
MRGTLIGALAATAVGAAVLTPLPTQAAGWTNSESVSGNGSLPQDAEVAMAADGDAVAVWLRSDGDHDRVQAASSVGGDWSAPVTVSDAGTDAHTPSVAINAAGDAVVTWSSLDAANRMRLAASRRLANGVGWDGRALISPIDEDVTSRAEVALDASGRLLAAYGAADGADNQVRVSLQKKGAVHATSVVSDDSAFLPTLAAAPDGTAYVAWYDVQGPQSQIRGSRLAAGSSTWAASTGVSFPGQHLPFVDAAISADGFTTVVYAGAQGDDTRIQATKIQPSGVVGAPNFVSPSGQDAMLPSVSQNDDGTAITAWRSTDDGDEGIGYATRERTGEWKAGTVSLPAAVTTPGAPRTSISARGTYLIGLSGNGRQLAAYRAHPLQPLTVFDSGPLGFVSEATRVAGDGQGNVLLAGVMKAANPAQGQVHASVLDLAGPTTSLAALPAHRMSAKHVVAWSASDRFSAVASTDLWQRSARWNGGFGAATPVVHDSAGSSAVAGLLPGRTYCYQAQSTDGVSNLGLLSAQRCTTTPTDDRTAKRSAGWKKRTGAKHYRGTVLETRRKGARLVYPGVQAKRVALVVAKVRGGGTVKVRFAGRSWTRKLSGSGARKVVTLGTFSGVRTGKLTITVTSRTGKRVRIDGVLLAR